MQYKVAVYYKEAMWYTVEAASAEAAAEKVQDYEEDRPDCEYDFTGDGEFLSRAVYDPSGQLVFETE